MPDVINAGCMWQSSCTVLLPQRDSVSQKVSSKVVRNSSYGQSKHDACKALPLLVVRSNLGVSDSFRGVA